MDESSDQRHESFLRLFTANDAALRSYVRTLVATRDDAAEIMQDISLVLWRKFESFQGQEDFRRWAFGVARFEVLAWRRDKARDRLVLSDVALDALAVQMTSDALQLDRRRDALEHCLDKLAEQQRALLKAAYAPGARLEQVAQDAGRSLESLYKMLQRLRSRLSDCVQRHALAGEPS